MKSSTSSSDIVAALVWDKPALQRSSSVGAARFVAALDRDSLAGAPDPEHLDALSQAAFAISQATDGDLSDARVLASSLSRRRGMAGLLGLFVLAWLTSDGASLWKIRERVLGIDDSHVRSMLLSKLFGMAKDAGQRELAVNVFQDARELIPVNSPRGFYLRFDAANELRMSVEFPASLPQVDDDLMVLPWVDSLVERACTDTIVGLAESTVTGPWRSTIRFGKTSKDRILAAESQCSWAGAFWKLKGIRKVAASLFLTNARMTPGEAEYGVANWVRGGGSNILEAVAWAERSFDSRSADSLLETWLKGFGGLQWERLPYSTVVAALWDLVSSSKIPALLAALPPEPHDPLLEAARQGIWGAFSVRVPDEWSVAFRELDPNMRLSVAAGFQSIVVRDLPVSIASELADELDDVGLGASGLPVPTVVGILSRAGRSRHEQLAAAGQATDFECADLVRMAPNLLQESVLARAAKSITQRLQLEVAKGLQGETSLGGPRPGVSLGQVLAAMKHPPQSSVRSLLDAVTEARLPQDIRVNALIGLDQVALVRRDKGIADVVREAEPAGVPSPWSPDLDEVFEVYAAAIQLSVGPTRSTRARLLAYARSRDARVRELAVAASTRYERRKPTPESDSVILAGLYDPGERVVTAALHGLRTTGLTPSSKTGVGTRLEELWRVEGRGVRQQVVLSLNSVGAVSPEVREHLRAIAEQSASDRSWVVRHATEKSHGHKTANARSRADRRRRRPNRDFGNRDLHSPNR